MTVPNILIVAVIYSVLSIGTVNAASLEIKQIRPQTRVKIVYVCPCYCYAVWPFRQTVQIQRNTMPRSSGGNTMLGVGF